MFFAMWVATSYSLHKLLLFYPERKKAVSAAFKKQIISRIGDLAILVAFFLIFEKFGTTNISEILTAKASNSV